MKGIFTFLFVLLFVVAAAVAQDNIPPEPVNYFDFEEADGVVVTDQGTAANNGEIVGDWIDRVDGGIVTKAGETGRCIEFFEENAFGELSYVLVPFEDYLNSPNYTLSAWVQYIGDPNWGYLFWADGDAWEPDLMDRHIDVWFNPSAGEGGGVDCILNLTDADSTLRVANNADDTGIGVMDGDWHQVTCVLEGAARYTIYIDGIWAAEDSSSIPVVENGGDDLYIGARPNNADATSAVKWVGLIDRVRIWDQALTEDQVMYLFDMEGPDGGTVSVEGKVVQPKEFALYANYPNPFNPTTTISYSLDRAEQVTLEVYDMIGHKIKTLISGVQPAGQHHLQWNGTDELGQMASTGVYLYRLSTSDRVKMRKMLLLK